VTSVGIMRSDLHWFTEGGIGEVGLEHPGWCLDTNSPPSPWTGRTRAPGSR
jgi:hypothetical protein